MKFPFVVSVAFLILQLFAPPLAFAGPIEDGIAAEDRGDLVAATRHFAVAAKRENREAQVLLGLSYFFGKGVKANCQRALYWLSRAARHDDLDAQRHLVLYFGLDAEGDIACGRKDDPLRLHWLRRAARHGGQSDQFWLGMYYAEPHSGKPPDYEKALPWFLKAADQGFYVAQGILARVYEKGQGVPVDLKRAIYWRTKSAAQGSPTAERMLGDAYERGYGVVQDLAVAIHWYQRAADQEDSEAQYQLGVLYAEGRGVPIDYVRAWQWFHFASTETRGYVSERAAKRRDLIAEKMSAAEMAEADRLVKAWRPTSEFYTRMMQSTRNDCQHGSLSACRFLSPAGQKRLQSIRF